MKKILLLVITVIFIVGNPVYSEAHLITINASASYVLGQGEDEAVGENKALMLAEDNALEQAGVYVEAYCKETNYKIVQQELKKITSQIIKVEKQKYKWEKAAFNGQVVNCAIVVTMDDSAIREIMAKGYVDKKAIQDNVQLKARKSNQDTELAAVNERLNHISQKAYFKPDDDDISYTAQAVALVNQKKYDEARKLFAERVSPYYVDGYLRYGQALFGAKKYKRCNLLMHEGIKNNPESGKLYRLAADAYFWRELDTKAIEYYKQALSLGISDGLLYANLAMAYSETYDPSWSVNNSQRAEDTVNKGFKLYPTDGNLYFAGGYVTMKQIAQGDVRELERYILVKKYFEKAVKNGTAYKEQAKNYIWDCRYYIYEIKKKLHMIE